MLLSAGASDWLRRRSSVLALLRSVSHGGNSFDLTEQETAIDCAGPACVLVWPSASLKQLTKDSVPFRRGKAGRGFEPPGQHSQQRLGGEANGCVPWHAAVFACADRCCAHLLSDQPRDRLTDGIEDQCAALVFLVRLIEIAKVIRVLEQSQTESQTWRRLTRFRRCGRSDDGQMLAQRSHTFQQHALLAGVMHIERGAGNRRTLDHVTHGGRRITLLENQPTERRPQCVARADNTTVASRTFR